MESARRIRYKGSGDRRQNASFHLDAGFMATTSAMDLASLRAVLGDNVPQQRLEELLEASNGNLERAIDTYFHQQTQTIPTVVAAAPSAIKAAVHHDSKPSRKSAVVSSSRKRSFTSSPPSSSQAKGLGGTGKGKEKNNVGSPRIKQSRLDSFFSSLNKKQATTTTRKIAPAIMTTTATLTSVSLSNPANSTVEPRRASGMSTSTHMDDTRGYNVDKKETQEATTNASTDGGDDDDDANTIDSSLVSFEKLAQVLQVMAETTKRNAKLAALESFIRSIWDTDLEGSSYKNNNNDDEEEKAKVLTSALGLVLGGRTVKPIGVSGSAVSKALCTTQGLSQNQLSKAYRQHGDLGDVAASFFQKRTFFVSESSLRRKSLSVLYVSQALARISETEGRDAKQAIVLGLLRRCQSRTEIKFLVRLLVANMRIGANLKTVLAALAMVVHKDLQAVASGEISPCHESSGLSSVKDTIALIQKTHDICPNLERIVCALLGGGVERMRRDCTIQVLVPIAPMLAHPIHGIEEVEKAMSSGEAADTSMIMEWKYDGMRCQAHYDGSTVKLFSRHMLEITSQFPDVAKILLESFAPALENGTNSSFIIDSEIVGVCGENLLPFQDLSTRKKNNDTDTVEGVQVKVFAFDLVYLDGKSYVNAPLWKRKDLLERSFKTTEDFGFVKSQTLTEYDEVVINAYLSDAVEKGAEGLMLKQLGPKANQSSSDPEASGTAVMASESCSYEAGTRSHTWLKMKRDYVAGFADTIDVVPIGAWYGNGRKAQKSFLSPVLLAVYDDEEDVFRSISRCMSFTDKMYESMREFYFHGTPYPENADGSTDDKGVPKGGQTGEEQKLRSFAGGDEDDDIDALSESLGEEGCDLESSTLEEIVEEAEDEVSDRVNCFVSRPSLAYIHTNEEPPVYFKPLEVFEVSFADLTLSRTHTAAAGMVDEEGRGVAMRFPRFKRRRPDKRPEQATTCSQIAQLYAKQSKLGMKNQNKGLL